MLSVEAVDSILFGTRNVTLELANVVNKTENAQRGLNPDLQPQTKSTRSTLGQIIRGRSRSYYQQPNYFTIDSSQ